MSLETLFRDAVHALEERGISYAVAGGIAVSLYRDEPRMTMDVDFVIWAEAGSLKMAMSVLNALGLEVGIARQADFAGGPLFAIRKGNTPACMVVGRAADKSCPWGVDILLPALPWAHDAVDRAQNNRVDFGFGKVPTVTLEDMVLAKLYALRAAVPRPKDMDDLQSIYKASRDELDTVYLSAQMRRFELVVPQAAKPFLPESLLAMSRDTQRQMRRS